MAAFACLLLINIGGLHAQQADPAELQSALKAASSDNERVDLLNDFSDAWRSRNTDSAFAFARRAYDLARSTGYVRGQGDARLNQAYAFLESGRPADATTTLEKARVDFEQSNDRSGLGKCALADAAIQFSGGLHFPALETCLVADSLFAVAEDSLGRIRTRFLQANIFSSQRADSLAVLMLDDALTLGADPALEARIHARKAHSLHQNGRTELALASYQSALDLLRQRKAYQEESAVLNRAAALHIALGDTAAALKNLVRARGIANKNDLAAAEVEALRQLGRLALAENRLDSARGLLEEAVRQLPDTTSAPQRAALHLDMVRLWLAWPDFDLALARTDSAQKWLDSVPDAALSLEVEELRYRIFNRIGATSRALAAMERVSVLRDSLRRGEFALSERGDRLSRTYSRLMGERSEKAEREAFEDAVQTRAQERELYLLAAVGGLGLLALLFLLLWLRNRSRARSRKRHLAGLQTEIDQADDEIRVLEEKLREAREEAYRRPAVQQGADPEKVDALVSERTRELSATVERLRGLNRELDTFMYRASHDLLGPIARLKGLVLVAQNSGSDVESLQAYVRLIEAVSVYMDRVLRKLIIVHELHHVNQQVEPVRISEIIEDITPRLSELPGISQPFILLHDELEAKVRVDAQLMSIVLENLLENACLFRSDPDNGRPRIQVWLRRVGRDIEIEMRDEGIGIPDQIREQVFDIFFRGSERSKGNGLGLYLVKIAVDLLGGRIELDSKEGVFTKVTVRIPDANS